MGFNYIQNKKNEIHNIRQKIMNEMGLSTPNKSQVSYTSIKRKKERNFDEIQDMKIACIMDEFTYYSFEPECNLLQLTPENWLNELKQFKPHMFFLESAWRGKNDLWNTKVAHLSKELTDVLNYCREMDIPIVFWNKEDPVHFETFISTAKFADYVFTTDIDCIKKYKTILKHDNVYVLPFAAQPKIHNPIEKFERKEGFCFAGAYYTRFKDRMHDIENFINATTSKYEVDIYDRNYYNNDPNYKFPKKYKKYIKGNLKPTEIDQAYKGYKFNINMNSVKQSQSMCARRVFELLASNTVIVSNYSRAIRTMLGDLVICTDDSKRLLDEVDKLNNEELYNKYRLQGLRKVLTEHTYSVRLNYIVNTVFEKKHDKDENKVVVIAHAQNNTDLAVLMKNFQRQKHDNKKMIIITNQVYIDFDNDHVEIINNLNQETLEMIRKDGYKFLAFFSPKDYYGCNYLYDAVLAYKYSDATVICKQTYFKNKDENIEKYNNGFQYKHVDEANTRRALLNLEKFDDEEIFNLSNSIDEGIVKNKCLSIDEYNYCMDFIEDECEIVDDIILSDLGISISKLNKTVSNIKPANEDLNKLKFNSGAIFKLLNNTRKINLSKENDNIYAKSRLSDSHEYVYLNKLLSIEDIKTNKKPSIYLNVDFIEKSNIDVVVIYLDQQKNKLGNMVNPCNKRVELEVPSNTKFLKIGIRFQGNGLCMIKELIIGDTDHDKGCFISKSATLLISDNYPEYQDLYRYAFIHSRLTEYKNYNKLVDVFRYNDRYSKGFTEFNGIDITTGNHEEINEILYTGEHNTVLIHFLSEKIWNGIKNSVKGKKIIVWVHGAEIQPWWRREYNYNTERQLEQAKKSSEERQKFWKEIFNLALNNDYDFHFVFVSKYFAEEVFEDYKIKLPNSKYSVIHNYIDNDLFSYAEKDKKMRTKVLSIRPFANNKYANDLTVKAILELSKEKFFKELEFRIIGKGELFISTTKPLKKFNNVILEEVFLRQEEIADLHKNYGICLTPTRMDAQGVSRDEAMSSGLVPITNNVAAIPEFVNDNCGMLVEAEDFKGLADAIRELYNNPEKFQILSVNAAERVREQCGKENTIVRELALINRNI